MQTEDKRDQIKAWFTTPNPQEPQEFTYQMSSAFGKGRKTFVVCLLVCYLVWLFLALGGAFERPLEWLFVHILLIIMLIIMTIIMTIIMPIRTYIKTKKENRKAKAEAKAKYDTAKAEYDAAKAEYDALTDQMVEWLKEDLANQEKSFHDKMIEGYHESTDESNEILLPETLFVWIPEMSKGKTERTEDGYNLCSEWTVNALNISKWTVIIGRWIYDWGENRVLSESIKEYPCLDIASIGTESNEVHEVLQIKMTDGEHVEFSVEGHLFVDDQGSQGLPSLNRIATSIRSRLRDAKNIDRTEDTQNN